MGIFSLFKPSSRVKVANDFEKSYAKPLWEFLRQQRYDDCINLMKNASSIEIDVLLYGAGCWPKALAYAQKWCSTQPESPYAHLLAGRCFQVKGWSIRGTGYANSVSNKAMKNFRQHLDSAQTHLQKAVELDPTMSAAYAAMILGGKCIATPLVDLENWFEQGVAHNPRHYMCHYQFMVALTEKWVGSHEWMFDFTINRSSSNAPMGDNLHILVACAYNEWALDLYSNKNPIRIRKFFDQLIENTTGTAEHHQILKNAFYNWLGDAQQNPENIAQLITLKQGVSRALGLNEFALALHLTGCHKEAYCIFKTLNGSIISSPWDTFFGRPKMFYEMFRDGERGLP